MKHWFTLENHLLNNPVRQRDAWSTCMIFSWWCIFMNGNFDMISVRNMTPFSALTSTIHFWQHLIIVSPIQMYNKAGLHTKTEILGVLRCPPGVGVPMKDPWEGRSPGCRWLKRLLTNPESLITADPHGQWTWATMGHDPRFVF